MKLKLKVDQMRVLSSFYDVSLQQIARKAAIAWKRSGKAFSGDYSTEGEQIAVLDVSSDYTTQEWREIIEFYTNREIENLPDAIEGELENKRAEAERLKAQLPKYVEVK